MNPALMAVALVGTAAAASPFDVTTFFSGFTLQDIGQTLGLGALAVLFATDRILTRGQHERRVADLVAGFEKLLAVAAERLTDMTASRDYYREAKKLEAARADKLASQLADLAVEASKTAGGMMTALEEAAREAAPE